MTDKFAGVKLINIYAKTTYPIVTAYEFEFLKTEEVVREVLKPCSIYIIAQRPLLYFKNMLIEDGVISFEIFDDKNDSPLSCVFNPKKNGFVPPEEDLLVDVQFYKHTPDLEPPFNDVAAFKLLKESGEFIVWYTPQKFIYEYFMGSLKAGIDGEITNFLDYKVHYIGQAFSQRVWDRLTGHEKMQSVLTMEDSLNCKTKKNSFEISLIILDVDGFDEVNIFPFFEGLISPESSPIIHELESEDDFLKFYSPHLETRSPQLTNEVEAMLINKFKPAYNKILFEKYPDITNGTRNAGYTVASLVVERLPAILSSDSYQMAALLPTEIK
jgi:hypothetical protein